MLVITNGFASTKWVNKDPFVMQLFMPFGVGLFIVSFILASLMGLNHVFNWPKFFVPKEYRGDRGLFVSDKRDLEEANILRAEALEAIESAPPKTRKRKRRK